MFENAKWITRDAWERWGYTDDPWENPPAPYIAKTFTLKDDVKRVTMAVCGLGQAAYYLNGVRIPDSLLPTLPFCPTKTVVYTVHDITALVCAGKNRIGALLGNNGYNDIGVSRMRSSLKLICQIDIEYCSGEKETIVSDTSWRTHPSPVVFSLRRTGEKHDGRLRIAGWCAPDFDDSQWDNARLCQHPGGKYRKAVSPPVRVRKTVRPVQLRRDLWDCGINAAGWVRVQVKGKRGDEIAIHYAERLREDGTADFTTVYNGIVPSMCHTDRFVLSGDDEEFEQLFGFHGFRYVQVEGSYETIELQAVYANTHLQSTAEFVCGAPMLNAIHALCVNSLLSNAHGALTDCPGREQNEWTGDGMLSAETAALGFDSYGMMTEWMYSFQDEQYPSGGLPCIIPMKNPQWEYNFANGPDWDSALFHIPYYQQKYTGNPALTEQMWENIERGLRYFGTRSESRLLSCGVGDWCSLEDEPCPREITDTVYYRIAARMMAELAQATGRDPAPYAALAAEIRTAFREKYVVAAPPEQPELPEQLELLEQTGPLGLTGETALAAALYGGMLEPEEEAAAAAQLDRIIRTNGCRLRCGVHGIRMIFDALSENGYAQTVFDTLTNPAFPGYARCVADGLTALPERFDYAVPKEGMDSMNHHFTAQVDVWFYKYLAGIRFEGFGKEHIVIAPCFVRGVDWLKAQVRGIAVQYDAATLTVCCDSAFTLRLGGRTTRYPQGTYRFDRNTGERQ